MTEEKWRLGDEETVETGRLDDWETGGGGDEMTGR